MTDLAALKTANAKRWANAKLTRGSEFARPAQKAYANKVRYQTIARRAKMPDIAWLFIACAHYRESSQDFTKNLGQGDPLDRVTVHVPKGRGPFLGASAFEDAAVDALANCPPYAARLTDWSIAGMLTNLERYNGLGYASKGRPSPYIWSGTDQYVSGKYVADGVYDPNAVDKQLGCAGLVLAIMALDKTIKFDAAAPAQVGTKTVAAATTAGATVAAGSYFGFGWLEIGLSAFIIAGLAVACVALVRRVRG